MAILVPLTTIIPTVMAEGSSHSDGDKHRCTAKRSACKYLGRSCEGATAAERIHTTDEPPSIPLLITVSGVTDFVRYRPYLAVHFVGDIGAYEVADHITQRANATRRV